MELIIYNVIDPVNIINKTIDNGTSINIRLKSETDIINPEILLSSIEGINYNDFNYCHIPLLERYYFINKVNNVNSRMWKLSCTCDVLETYKQEILKSHARFRRCLKSGDFQAVGLDSSVKTVITKFESNKQIFNEGSTLILSTLGV